MEECAPGLLALPWAGGAPVLVVAGGAIPPEHRGQVHPHDAPVDARAGGGEGGGGGAPGQGEGAKHGEHGGVLPGLRDQAEDADGRGLELGRRRR